MYKIQIQNNAYFFFLQSVNTYHLNKKNKNKNNYNTYHKNCN
jgi:hypothetical protein